MYAILRQGNHQYRVTPGDIIQVEQFEAEKGQEVDLGEVLVLNDGTNTVVGTPHVEDAKVTAKVLRGGRGKKVLVFHFRRRKGFHKTQGHRQNFVELMITGLHKNGKKLEAAAK